MTAAYAIGDTVTTRAFAAYPSDHGRTLDIPAVVVAVLPAGAGVILACATAPHFDLVTNLAAVTLLERGDSLSAAAALDRIAGKLDRVPNAARAAQIRAAAASGEARAATMQRLGCSRQAYASALRSRDARGRPRKGDGVTGA